MLAEARGAGNRGGIRVRLALRGAARSAARA
jgi:hypothetical protein